MPKILLVEDDEDSYDMLMGRIEHKGYEVDLATTGEESLDMVGEANYDLILMDIRLPGFDGYEATHRIRERSDGDRYVPIIAITAYALEEDREKALAAGCDDYHAKPVHFSKLIEQMETLLGEEKAAPGQEAERE
jgi:CheY-like chemotaxis protein